VPAERRVAAEEHQCIVVGAGVLGLAAACSLSHRDVEVLLLEASSSGHEMAGSKGSSRIFRIGYPDPLYVEMAVGALAQWRLLENESGCDLLTTTGQLSFGPDVAAVSEAMAQTGMEFEDLSKAEAAARFPALQTAGPALFEPESGVLAADQCLRAIHDSGQFTVRSGQPVAALESAGDEVGVVLRDGTRLSAEVVVNCAGPDALDLLPGLRCGVRRPPTWQQVVYFDVDADAAPPPVFIEWGPDMIYGLPVPGQPRYKLAQHVPGPPRPDDAATAAEQGDDPTLVATLVEAAKRLLPNVEPTPVATERCLYDNTADGDFILDRVGRVVVGCGTSGHGFKFAPLLGDLLADLAMGLRPPIDLGRFSVARSHLRAVPDQ
jgi:sarcosine oxidase